MTDREVFESHEVLRKYDGEGRPARVLVLCDHATNIVPDWVNDLGVSDADMQRHIAIDVGARGVSEALGEAMGASVAMSRFSRLVIDPNRGEDDPTLVMKLYDGTIIPGNRAIDQAGIEARLERLHRPYHAAIKALLDDAVAADCQPVIVSVHSFTPRLGGGGLRPWHVGLLWDRDDRLVAPLLALLRETPDLVVGDNEPYRGDLRGDSMFWHGTRRGIPHVLIEIRNDLISDAEGQRAWADRLAPLIRDAIAEMDRAAA